MYIKPYERFILCFAWTSGGHFWLQETVSYQKEKNQIQAECWKHLIHFNKQPLRPKFLPSTPVRYNEREGKYLHCFPCFLLHMQAFMTNSAPQFRNSRKSGFGNLKTTFMRNILWCWRRIRIFNLHLWFNLWFIKTLKWTIQNASLGIEKSRQHSLISSAGLRLHRFVVIYVPSLSSPQVLPASRKANTFQRWV